MDYLIALILGFLVSILVALFLSWFIRTGAHE
jgi:hypothetical protein